MALIYYSEARYLVYYGWASYLLRLTPLKAHVGRKEMKLKLVGVLFFFGLLAVCAQVPVPEPEIPQAAVVKHDIQQTKMNRYSWSRGRCHHFTSPAAFSSRAILAVAEYMNASGVMLSLDCPPTRIFPSQAMSPLWRSKSPNCPKATRV